MPGWGRRRRFSTGGALVALPRRSRMGGRTPPPVLQIECSRPRLAAFRFKSGAVGPASSTLRAPSGDGPPWSRRLAARRARCVGHWPVGRQGCARIPRTGSQGRGMQGCFSEMRRDSQDGVPPCACPPHPLHTCMSSFACRASSSACAKFGSGAGSRNGEVLGCQCFADISAVAHSVSVHDDFPPFRTRSHAQDKRCAVG